MEWDYDVEAFSCCGSHNHWAQDCPRSYHPDHGSRGYQNYNQSDKGGNEQNRNAIEEDKILELFKTLLKHVEELTQSLKEQQNINESLNQRIEQLTNQFDNFAERKATVSLVEDAGSETDRDPGEPLIPIQLGDLKTDNASLNFGVSMSVLPGYIYDRYDLGPLQQVNDPMVLSEYSRGRPRGILKGLTVKICCWKGTVDMTYGSRKLSIDFLSHSFDYSFINTCSWDVVTNTSYSRVCDDGPKESVAMIDRSKDDKIVKDKEAKSPWWLKLRIKKQLAKRRKMPPKEATKSKKNPIETRTGELLYSFDDTDPDNPDHWDAIRDDGWMWDDNHVFHTQGILYEPP
ncbi:hypothetical protein Hdeb2414_s0080g00780171 [Helianthus debilis subsp. tardiflorus]